MTDASDKTGYLGVNWLVGVMVTVLLLLIGYSWSSTIFPMVNRLIALEQWRHEHERDEFGPLKDRVSRLEKDVERINRESK